MQHPMRNNPAYKDEKIDFDTAKRLIAEYKKQVEKGGK